MQCSPGTQVDGEAAGDREMEASEQGGRASGSLSLVFHMVFAWNQAIWTTSQPLHLLLNL